MLLLRGSFKGAPPPPRIWAPRDTPWCESAESGPPEIPLGANLPNLGPPRYPLVLPLKVKRVREGSQERGRRKVQNRWTQFRLNWRRGRHRIGAL